MKVNLTEEQLLLGEQQPLNPKSLGLTLHFKTGINYASDSRVRWEDHTLEY